MKIDAALKDAEKGGFSLWKLNFFLLRGIPFNKPHGLKIKEIREGYARVDLPYKRSNFNHLKGMHACALATLSEYTTGLVMLRTLGASKYRLIMKSLQMDYHYQGKSNVHAEFRIAQEEIKRIEEELQKDGASLFIAEIKVHDLEGNHLCTGKVEWQLKDWKAVKTR